MKSAREILNYLEKELKIIALEDLNISEDDSMNAAKYKSTQMGKCIAYEKMIAFILDTHNNVNPPMARKNKDDRNPVIVCL